MKIIFLDIDGVLNHELFYKDREKANRPSPDDWVEWKAWNIDPVSVQYLNSLIEDTGAKVVLSSSWRVGTTKEDIIKILEAIGFKGELIDFTPRLGRGSVRGCEIRLWIEDNYELLGKRSWEFDTYVIFDDDSDMLLWQQYNYIKIDRHCGLTPNNVYKAKNILNRYDGTSSNM